MPVAWAAVLAACALVETVVPESAEWSVTQPMVAAGSNKDWFHR